MSAATMKHTALPWRVEYMPGTDAGLRITSEVTDTDVTRHHLYENAEFIVRACNTHDKLVDTLQRALDTIDACGSINMDEARALVKQARKAAR